MRRNCPNLILPSPSTATPSDQITATKKRASTCSIFTAAIAATPCDIAFIAAPAPLDADPDDEVEVEAEEPASADLTVDAAEAAAAVAATAAEANCGCCWG